MSLTADPSSGAVQPRATPGTGGRSPVAGDLSAVIVRTAPRFAIGLTAFLGAFVINEPAPYELFLLVIMVLFLFFGMRLSRIAITLGALMILFNIGGMLSMFTMKDFKEIPLYLAVTLFLGLSSVFWAAAIEGDMGRLRVLMRGYVIGATVTALLGILGYFNAFPGSEIFTLYDRAKGAFQDPNVFGPFLVLPALYLAYGSLYRSPQLLPIRLAILGIILFAVFLSFSRGAWAVMAVAGASLYAMLLMTELSSRRRLQLILSAVAGLVVLTSLLLFALQFDAVHEMFEQRARLVQEYDGAQFGRFARHSLGFQWALEHPLGIGPLEFGQILGEDTHNIWLKSLMAYGWIGFFSYVTITVCTLVGGGRLIGRIRPWQPYLLCAYAAYLGHIVLGWVIDMWITGVMRSSWSV